MSTLNTDLHDEAYGYLQDVQVINKFHKTYLHLTNSSHPVCTLVLCSRTPAALEELQVLFHFHALIHLFIKFHPGQFVLNGVIVVQRNCTCEFVSNGFEKSISKGKGDRLNW